MTASVSRPSTIACTASAWPGRSSVKPKTSRATRSMAGATASGMCSPSFPTVTCRKHWCRVSLSLARVPKLVQGQHPNRGEEMFERIRNRRFGRDGEATGAGGGVATAERDDTRVADRGNGSGDGHGTATATRRPVATGAGVAAERDSRVRAREEFGGINWGAAFFGFLVAIGMAVILTAIVGAAGTAIGLSTGASANDAGTIGIVGGALLIAILCVSYYCGGYVAGRMSRFDGLRQGFGTWLVGLVLTLLAAAAGAIFGSQYNVTSGLNLPRIPVDEGTLTTGGAITLAAIVIGTLIFSLIGGKAGQRYHRRVDRLAQTW